MTHVTPTRVLPPLVALLLALPAFPAAPALAQGPIPFEVGISAREAGHLRALFEQLNKQNVLYQFHLGGVTKQAMQETTARIDRVLETLEKGSPVYSVAPPVNKAVREQIHAIEGDWSKLRRLALASPYDYLRFSNGVMPKRSGVIDPLNIRVFDDITVRAIGKADKLQLMILEECNKTGYEFCSAARRSGAFNMNIQRIAKHLVLIYAGFDVDDNVKGLNNSVTQIDGNLTSLASSPILTGAIAPNRGRSADFVSALWGSIQEGWGKMRFEADLAMQGRADGLDIQRMLEAQRSLVNDLDRFRSALSRFAEAQIES